MIQKIKSLMLFTLTALAIGVPVLAPVTASALCSGKIQEGLQTGINGTTGSTTGCTAVTGDGAGSITALAKKVVNIFSLIVGVVAVIFVIYGGFRYITSGGDSGNVGNAKNTLIYALVGLVIVALAQLIVRYVLTTAVAAGNGQ